MSTPLPPGQRAALIVAISPQRLEPHHRLATAEGLDVIELYLWDRDLAAAAIADIAVLEVALRNAMNAALVTRAGREDWYATDIGLDDRSLRAITKAWTQLPAARRTPGRVVSQLMFGFWRALLDSGATVGQGPLQRTVSYEELWRADLHRAFPGGRTRARASGARFTRPWVLATVGEVQALRNRAAHHEALIDGFPLPGQARRRTSEHGHHACVHLAHLLDADLGAWLETNSAMATVLARRPAPASTT